MKRINFSHDDDGRRLVYQVKDASGRYRYYWRLVACKLKYAVAHADVIEAAKDECLTIIRVERWYGLERKRMYRRVDCQPYHIGSW